MPARSKHVWLALPLVLPAAFWIASLAVSKQLPLFTDSQIAIGAGARLYHHGHLAETCMLHGLINPYLQEGLLRLGWGAFAPYALRLAQFLIALGSICLVYRIGLKLDEGSSRSAVLISTALAALCSTILLVEAFELTPENVMIFCLLLLLHRLVVYEPKTMHSVTTGAVMALLIGARPSSFILWVPVMLVIPRCFSPRAFAARYWRWIVFTVLVIAALLAPFPDAVPIGTVLAICGGLVIAVTLICAIRDLRAGFGEVWKNLALVLLSALLALAILFPNYVIHLGELMRQTSRLHVAIEEPCGSVADYSGQLVYSLSFLVITFPGPLAAVGVFAGIAQLISKRKRGDYGRLLLFALGTIPFFLLSCRYVNFQSRYLIPLMGTALVVSAIGLRCIMRMGSVRYLLILPMLVSVFQLSEVVRLRPNGGLLNALSALGRYQNAEVSGAYLGTCSFPPHYYSDEDSVCWPLVPYVDPDMITRNAENADYTVSYLRIPPGYVRLRTFGKNNSEHFRPALASEHPYWSSVLLYYQKPWLWRDGGVVHLSRRQRDGG